MKCVIQNLYVILLKLINESIYSFLHFRSRVKIKTKNKITAKYLEISFYQFELSFCDYAGLLLEKLQFLNYQNYNNGSYITRN
jgi:hypothetical protein